MNTLIPIQQSLLLTAGSVFLYMHVWFALSLLKKRADIVDVAWGPGFIVISSVLLLQRGDFNPRALLTWALVTLWGGRLAWHIHRRNHGKPEDFRYAQWRQEWGQSFLWRSWLQVYLLQGVLMMIVAGAILQIMSRSQGPLTALDALGVLVWVIGFGFEAIGDAQLTRFKRDPAHRGKVIQHGLWRYTRHPNYFGEVVLWWGIWLLGAGLPGAAFSVLAPATITFLILKVSGIPMLEAKYAGNPEFEAYKQRTSAFWPWWPRHTGN